MTTILEIGGALTWKDGFSVDADGAPNAYAPAGSGLLAMDYLSNAGRPGNWWALAVDQSGEPIVQGDDDPCPGYYVSTTALVDGSRPHSDPRRYVDATRVPYVSIARDLHARGIVVGDVAMVLYQDRRCGAIVADVGPTGQYGEGSIALAEALGIPSSPKTGGCADGVTWIVFLRSRTVPPWPRPVDDFQGQAEALFAQLGPDRIMGLLGA